MKALLDAILVDLGGVVVDESPDDDGHDIRPRDGVIDDLAWLGAVVGIGAVTNTAIMDTSQVRKVLEPSGLATVLPVIVTSLDAGTTKARPAVLLEAMTRLGTHDPARVLVVGDRPAHEEAALAAGMAYVDITSATTKSSDESATGNGNGNGNGNGASATPVEANGRGALRRVVTCWVESTAGHRFELARAAVAKSSPTAAAEAATLHAGLAKPLGALGRLESLGAQLAGIAGVCPPPSPGPTAVAVFAADHGVAEWNVSAWPQKRTAQMLANVLEGGASVSVLARSLGASLTVVDVGVSTAAPLDQHPNLVQRRVRAGTDNLATGAAMSRTDVLLALDVGAEMAQRLIADGAHSLIAGDIGIGNSTAAAAVIAAITNSSEDDVAGRASGADDDMLARKKAIIGAALGTLTAAAGPLTVLEQVGGLELAAITGFIVAGAAARVPVIIDGVAADAALLLAVQLAPDLIDFVVAGHRSGEPAAHVALSHLGIAPLLDLDLRLGEGSGALLALPLLHAAVDVMSGMSVLDALDAFPPTGEVAAVRI